jgi:hypothetical protein
VPDPGSAGWRTIGALAELVGGYCWVEGRLFELTGVWASDPDTEDGPPWGPEFRVFLAAASRYHGEMAARWYERLPVRAGVDPGALVVPPVGPDTDQLHSLASETWSVARLTGLVQVYLPRVMRAYRSHLVGANPASEGPVMAVLGPALRSGSEEIARGRSLLDDGVRRGWWNVVG